MDQTNSLGKTTHTQMFYTFGSCLLIVFYVFAFCFYYFLHYLQENIKCVMFVPGNNVCHGTCN